MFGYENERRDNLIRTNPNHIDVKYSNFSTKFQPKTVTCVLCVIVFLQILFKISFKTFFY
jgi:hypothetical protein